jgi:hypothetical protein
MCGAMVQCFVRLLASKATEKGRIDHEMPSHQRPALIWSVCYDVVAIRKSEG